MALALSDEQLARILIAGTGLSVKKQCRLLRLLANAVDPPPPKPATVRSPRTRAAKKRAANRVRWRAWHRRHQAGQAVAGVTFSGVVVAKLIMSGWLVRVDAEVYSTEAVAEAISRLLAEADLPPRK
jgi:hypothetical protein